MGDKEWGNFFSLGIKHPLWSYHKRLCCESPRHIWRSGWSKTLYDFRIAGYSIPFHLSPAMALHRFLSSGDKMQQVKVLGQVHSVEAMRVHPSVYLGVENTCEGCDRRLRFFLFLNFLKNYYCFLTPTSLPSSNVP